MANYEAFHQAINLTSHPDFWRVKLCVSINNEYKFFFQERIKVSKIGNREKGELIAKVDRSRINYEKTLPQPAAFFTNVIVQPQQQPPPHPPRPTSPSNAQLNQGQSGSSSRSSTPPKLSMKKRAAPKPPAINQVKSTNSSRDSSPNNSTVS